MKTHYREFSDDDRLAFNTGFNQGYKMAETLKETNKVYLALKAECEKGNDLSPYCQGVVDGIRTKDYLHSFLRDIERQLGRGKIDPDLDL
tara:strand:- start:643 stop:912 length:270 start_codon:yes stop_codon:yes gene_type:complete